MNKAAWAAFWILGFIWGSSFLLIRIGVKELPPTELVFIRCVIAAIGLNIVRWLRHKPLPTDMPTIRAFIWIGLGNAVIPYTLIAFGEQYIDSGMAAVLQATAALFTLVIAHFAFTDERITWKKIVGLVIGFGGVIVLSSKSINAGVIDTPMLMGQMAIVGASLFYAVFVVYSRKVIRRQIEPIVIAAGTFIPAVLWSAVFMLIEPLVGGRAPIGPAQIPGDVLLAVFGLGFVNTFIAYLFFYYIIRELGAFRASMVTYIVPPVGLILGAIILSEEISSTMQIGAGMIFIGIAFINLSIRKLLRDQWQRMRLLIPRTT